MLLTAAAAASVSLALEVPAQNRGDRFRMRGSPATEDPTVVDTQTPPARRFTEAPTGFDSLTNGYLDQGPDFDTLEEDTVVPFRSFNDNRFIFEEVERRADGLGPVYNAQACRECHQNVATGGASQIAEHRTGRLEDGVFFESLGGSLIHSRATDPRIVERVSPADGVRTFRISTNTLGAGYVEAIPNIGDPRRPQRAAGRDERHRRPGAGARSERPSADRAFRLESAAREPRVVLRRRVSERDGHHEPAAAGGEHLERRLRRLRHRVRLRDAIPRTTATDVRAFADFMRSTKAPSRGDITADVLAGETRLHSDRLRDVSHADVSDVAARHADQRRQLRRARRRSATRSSIRTAISCCTTSAPGDGIPITRRISRAPRTRCAPRRSGRCARAAG